MKDVIGYEGLYAVTSCGKVWSYRKKRFLKPWKGSSGYLQVSLSKNGEVKAYLVHRLVQEIYLPNPNNLPCVNHRDENKKNNALPNLEWCTYEYNNNYGSHNEKSAKSRGKPVYCVELNRTFESAYAAARELDLHQSSINRCCTGKQKTTGGLHFRYANE